MWCVGNILKKKKKKKSDNWKLFPFIFKRNINFWTMQKKKKKKQIEKCDSVKTAFGAHLADFTKAWFYSIIHIADF